MFKPVWKKEKKKGGGGGKHSGFCIKQGFTKGIAWEPHRGEWETDRLNFSHLSVLWLRTNRWFELLLYSFTVKGKESDTIWSHENLPTFLLYGFTVTAAYLTSFLPVFLSSAYINTKSWSVVFNAVALTLCHISCHVILFNIYIYIYIFFFFFSLQF